MADQPANLAQLKRACTVGARLQIINHGHPEHSRVTEVTKASTVDLITRARQARYGNGDVVEHAHLPWRKASDWTFDETGAHLHEGTSHVWLDLVVLGDDPGDRKLPNLVGWQPGKAWVNVECEGTDCSVGPFLDTADANYFRAIMFADPDHGETAKRPTGERMSVRQFQDAFRADFVGDQHHRPPHWWHAR